MLYVIKQSPIHGKGVFASQDIPEDTTVGEYTGELIDGAECEKREAINDLAGLTYIFTTEDPDVFIDGSVGGSDMMWVNHSCDPNMDIVYEGIKVFLKTNRDIKSGKELFYDYAFPLDSIRAVCECGAKNCRGTINDVV